LVFLFASFSLHPEIPPFTIHNRRLSQISAMKNQDQDQTVLNPDKIREIAYNFRASRILLTAYELGIFTIIGDHRRTSSEISRALKTDRRATDRLLNALVPIGFCIKEKGKFRNSTSVSRFLVRGKPEYLAGLMHTVHLWDNWSTLTTAVTKGTSVAPRGRTSRGSADWLESFIAAMHDRAKHQAPAAVSGIDLTGVERVLDVGGGPGTFAMAFVNAQSGMRATVFDLPNVVPLTRRYLRESGLASRIDTIAGDYLVDALPKGYDIVFLSAIIHSNSPAENKRLFRNCVSALRTNGRVVVQDWIMDEERTNPVQGVFFAINMLVGTRAGDTFTEAEVTGWMKSAGLSHITRLDTASGTTQIIGRKIRRPRRVA
jgi:SAM-dependent methyltransferase